MCGIAGILYKERNGGRRQIGEALIGMLDGCQHRGPDSTGFALYHEANGERHLRLRFFVGEGDEAARTVGDIEAKLAEHDAAVVEKDLVGTTARFTVSFDGDLQAFSYAMEHVAPVASIGESLDIIKDVGGAHDVDDVYHVARFTGTHGIGHVRLATESEVSPEAGHPFWATGFADVAIVHNGQITNYWKMRRRLEKRGFEFGTDNDSELIAVYLADKLEQGVPLAEALETSIQDLDGTFSFLVSTRDEIGYAKDRLAAKPMVMYEDDELVAIASEEVSLNKLFPGKSLETTEPAPGDVEDVATLDLATLPVREANERLRELGDAGEDVDILNPDARHHVGVGLTAPIRVRVLGSAGYFCAGLTDGPRFEVHGNVGWGLGDNMLSGSVVVHGNASAIAGVAIRGADVVVRGNIGSRAGQVMKEGSTLCCGGNASFMAGYMMYGGRLIICGDSGQQVGQDIHGGTIYVGGRMDTLGTDAEEVDLEDGEEDDVLGFLERYEIPFSGRFRKVVNAGRNLHYPRTEPRVRVIPFFVGSERTDYWNAKVQEDIAVKAQIGRYRIRGYGAGRPLPHLSDLAFKRDLHAVDPDGDVVGKVELRTSLGGRFGAVPIDLSMPVMIAPMSYGALSKSTKIALAKASAAADICDNTGEGGLIPEVREAAKRVVVQCLGGRLGWSAHVMRQADGVEIYISQGAKPGLGGQLMAKKVTADIARLRGIPAGIDLRSPSRHPDVLGADDLVIKVEEFREATGYQKPVSVKLGAGRVRDDIKIAYKDGFDYVCLDGVQGSTGAAGSEVLEYVGIPTLSGIMEGLDALAEIEATGMPVVLMGGVKDGIDTAKAIALGAHAVAVGTSAIIAGGCIACLQCHVGQCVVGIATQDPVHEQRYDIDVESRNIHRYLESLRWQLASVVHAHGYRSVYELSRDDLVALTPEAAEITRLPYAPEYAEQREILRAGV